MRGVVSLRPYGMNLGYFSHTLLMLVTGQNSLSQNPLGQNPLNSFRLGLCVRVWC